MSCIPASLCLSLLAISSLHTLCLPPSQCFMTCVSSALCFSPTFWHPPPKKTPPLCKPKACEEDRCVRASSPAPAITHFSCHSVPSSGGGGNSYCLIPFDSSFIIRLLPSSLAVAHPRLLCGNNQSLVSDGLWGGGEEEMSERTQGRPPHSVPSLGAAWSTCLCDGQICGAGAGGKAAGGMWCPFVLGPSLPCKCHRCALWVAGKFGPVISLPRGLERRTGPAFLPSQW